MNAAEPQSPAAIEELHTADATAVPLHCGLLSLELTAVD